MGRVTPGLDLSRVLLAVGILEGSAERSEGINLVYLDLANIFGLLSFIYERLLDPQLRNVRLLIDKTLLEVYEEIEQWNSNNRNN